MLVNAEKDIDVVAEANDGEDALVQIRAHRPDVVLMDVRMPGTDGVAATRAVTRQSHYSHDLPPR
jgi:YesN/AraC family two-component response regulator